MATKNSFISKARDFDFYKGLNFLNGGFVAYSRYPPLTLYTEKYEKFRKEWIEQQEDEGGAEEWEDQRMFTLSLGVCVTQGLWLRAEGDLLSCVAVSVACM